MAHPSKFSARFTPIVRSSDDGTGLRPGLIQRYQATMVLGAIGDAFGYKNGHWKNNDSAYKLQDEVKKKGGVYRIIISKEDGFRLSANSIMYLHTAKALASPWKDKEELYQTIAKEYCQAAMDFYGRGPGVTTVLGIDQLRPGRPKGYHIPYNHYGGGSGAAVRACSVGLLFPHPEQIHDLVAVAIECARMTHNNITACLGAVGAALFITYALQERPRREWGAGLLSVLPFAKKYLEETGRDVDQHMGEEWHIFYETLIQYLHSRCILSGDTGAIFQYSFNMYDRDSTFRKFNHSGHPGGGGLDVLIIVYEALMYSMESWEKLCHYGMFHSGDTDCTGLIVAAIWGASYGYEGVPKIHYHYMEHLDPLFKVGIKLYEKAFGLPLPPRIPSLLDSDATVGEPGHSAEELKKFAREDKAIETEPSFSRSKASCMHLLEDISLKKSEETNGELKSLKEESKDSKAMMEIIAAESNSTKFKQEITGLKKIEPITSNEQHANVTKKSSLKQDMKEKSDAYTNNDYYSILSSKQDVDETVTEILNTTDLNQEADEAVIAYYNITTEVPLLESTDIKDKERLNNQENNNNNNSITKTEALQVDKYRLQIKHNSLAITNGDKEGTHL